MQARFRHVGDSIDHTPGSDVAAGAVVVVGSMVTVATRAIAANAPGALAVRGVFEFVKVTGAFSKGAKLYWDEDGDPLGGTAGTGALSTDSSVGEYAGRAAQAAAETDETVLLLLSSAAEAPVDGTVTGNLAVAGTMAGTSNSAAALSVGRQGATAPALKVDASASNSATGMEVVAAAAASGVNVRAISSGTNENLTINAKGSGTITLGSASTGNVVSTRKFDASAAGLRTIQAVTDVDGTAPTKEELTTALGDPSTIGRGFIGTVDDNDGNTNFFLCVASDADWFYAKLTKAVPA